MVGRIEGKIILITGAGQGLGRECAVLFAKEGGKIIATDVAYEKLEDLASTPGVIKTIRVDVTNKDDILNLAKEVGRVDVIVNCAGIVPGGTILDCSDEMWQKTLDLNVRGTFWVCQSLIPLSLEAKTKLAVVNISSVCSSIRGVPNRFIYGVSKGAIIALTKSIAADFVGQGVRANSILPGTFESPSWRDRVNQSEDPEKARADFIARQKMGRIGTAGEIASLALYLACPESDFVTGQEFIIDGGWCI
ncbi:unnamed protein product [Orchesella dallaii]|uniref:Dehydrogenase/reductase SDR family member 6 n=1 Tax=Orchesella dallaii TaxID=48710 RepID=A0ABP1PTU2_9HEXA